MMGLTSVVSSIPLSEVINTGTYGKPSVDVVFRDVHIFKTCGPVEHLGEPCFLMDVVQIVNLGVALLVFISRIVRVVLDHETVVEPEDGVGGIHVIGNTGRAEACLFDHLHGQTTETVIGFQCRCNRVCINEVVVGNGFRFGFIEKNLPDVSHLRILSSL